MDRVCTVCCTRTGEPLDNKKLSLTPSSNLLNGWCPDTLKFPVRMGLCDTEASSGFSEKAPPNSCTYPSQWSVTHPTTVSHLVTSPLTLTHKLLARPEPHTSQLLLHSEGSSLPPLPRLSLLKGSSPSVTALQPPELSHHVTGIPAMLQLYQHTRSSHPSCSAPRLCADVHAPWRWVSFCPVLTCMSSALLPPPCIFAFCPCPTIFSLNSRL